ncbi:hypothetical protein BJ170DRAFT_604257 [Xylariales sp. AK1849]|nr:hypothetical protein BJ170DRAFT_604257 [Xylariales sp. AK1849]
MVWWSPGEWGERTARYLGSYKQAPAIDWVAPARNRLVILPIPCANEPSRCLSVPSMSSQSCRLHLFPVEEPVIAKGLSRLSELSEFIPSMTCVVVSTSYIIRTENPVSNSLDPSPPRIGFLTDPSPGLMLGSCLVLGCCLSSFAHRRRDEDRFQTAVFVAMAIWGVVVGRAIGASANMITLSLVPGALCTAMALSFMGHEFGRWLIARPRRQVSFNEKEATTFED